PEADPDLAAKVVDDYAPAMEWVRALGVHVADPVTVLGYGRGSATDMANFLLTCERIVRDRGELLVSSEVERLLVEGGTVTGAEVTLAGETRVIRAASTLLATGG